MKKTIITGMLTNDESWKVGKNSFTCFNGDIEIDAEGDEVYIIERLKENSNETEEIITKIKTMPERLQQFIRENKREIEITV